MSSSASKNRLRLTKEILENRKTVDIPYDYYFLNNYAYIAIEGNYRLRCAECIRRDRKCVNMS